MGPKVLSLFCRDALKIPSFPIDRHVRCKLEAVNLPINENALIGLCILAGWNTRQVATALVRSGIDGGNPDWSSA